jgi:hypothetical protein
MNLSHVVDPIPVSNYYNKFPFLDPISSQPWTKISSIIHYKEHEEEIR